MESHSLLQAVSAPEEWGKCETSFCPVSGALTPPLGQLAAALAFCRLDTPPRN